MIKSRLGDLATIKHGIEVDKPQKVEDFSIMLCHVGDVGEADTRKVVSTPSGTQLGYAFPLTSLRAGTGIAEGWGSRFAEVGFRKLVSLDNIDRYSLVRATADLRNGEFFVDELFSDEHVMFVFSDDGLRKAGLTLESLHLSLLEQNIHEVERFGLDFVKGDVTIEDQHINLRVPAALDIQDVAIFCKLIRQADNEQNSVGSFLIYYQLIEYCIDRIFQIEIKELPKLEVDTWTLKERLSDITNEVGRIGKLDQHYLSKNVRRSKFTDLKQECLQILASAGDPQEADITWYKALYKVRNMVVHNQMRFHRHAGKVELSAANKALRAACTEALFSFSPKSS
ncbi:hypothetical protein [Rhizobium sp. BK060]|uniref:hypothetical protein n=1 Tax=Rhizobium sp. BK060 TaxID=2587096 RepID=UPI00160E794B|nr:hypothetical protein [Rhizobium sp. BK060]MBB3399699.1 hypothetical protein [Rhizobium sp. BK060]